MKKTFLQLSLSILMGFSLPVLAQNDSSRNSPKALSDSIQIESDTITIGNMLIVKKQGEQNYNKSRGTIAIGNVVIVKKQGERNYNFNRRTRKPYGTTINITDGKITKDTFLSVNEDTVRLGRLRIIKSQDSNYKKDWASLVEEGNFDNTNITINRVPKKLKNLQTNWWTLDLGFANYHDKSPLVYWLAANPNVLPYGPGPINPKSLSLNNKKSSNVNLWIVQQKLNIYQHKINLKYGVGVEMFNFRFEKPISFREDIAGYLKYDDVTFTKNKLLVKYLTVPVQISFKPNPNLRKGFYASVGMSAGYLLNAKNKQISAANGKQKYAGNFNLNDWRVATIGELGVGPIRLYGSYGMTNLFNKSQVLFDMQPFALGLRFSKF